jgi:polyhydroxyalkanoate synthesis regulator phasin
MKQRIIWALTLAGIMLAVSFSGIGTPTAAAAPPAQAADEGELIGPPEREGRHHLREALVFQLIRITADVSGIPINQVIDELQNGSLADVAGAHGSSGEAVIQEAQQQASDRLAEAVANGRITQERADALLERISEHITEVVNNPDLGEAVAQRQERQAKRVLVDATADITRLSFREIMQRVRSGDTIDNIVTSENHTVDEVVDQAASVVQHQLNHIIDGGHITQEESDALLQDFRERAERLAYEVWDTR